MTQSRPAPRRSCLGRAFLFGLLGLAAAFFLLRDPDTDAAAMRAKYGGPTSHFMTMQNGQTLHYRDQGKPDGDAMLLIHGSSASLHTWQPLIDRLGQDYRIITLDLPGHGLSGFRSGGSMDRTTLVEAVDALATHLKLDRFILGGNSLGGRISWQYALAHPGKPRALLLLDAGGMPLRAGEKAAESNFAFRLMRTTPGQWLMPHFTPRMMVEKSLRQSIANQAIATPAMIDRYWELNRYPGNRRASAQMFAEPFIDAALAEQARTIKLPTLIIFGREDRIVNPSAAQTFHERITGSEVVMMDGIGHLPMEEAPDQTANAIRDFLKRRLVR